MKLTNLLILFLLLSFKGFSRPATTITSSITITQVWIDANLGPWEITTSSVTVTFSQNLTISNSNQYFIIKQKIEGVNSHLIKCKNKTGLAIFFYWKCIGWKRIGLGNL